mmetsp:Transcript_14120/g.16667  ORF Transcript_14120/g.16667 Transcript_14120/m.16667 type:complete len:199 (+) Transcript_14120:19-615(+)|eukprot:CAMPEP_0198249178 /NCGR_PEP_ID=MMETSP1447-20131203/766_1 /TAXON_ID=420782 /ORGANISM="Chaetoceros dichaeta, Strain CCMP1751" /LENGTH=198 /DNA_ID=CAMNT_0043933741 /DNA_START=42 /DNA_END=638 /DNA_ORIENTATION=-
MTSIILSRPLSPHASPFAPFEAPTDADSIFREIYFNGVPQLVAFGEHSDHEVIHNIPDEAIDELFPPTATDAAELDATDDFLRTMVDLSYLEEREEKARNEFSHVKKRWESRRQDGMKGKGKLTQNRVGMRHVIHGASILDPAERNIVTYGNHIARTSFPEQGSRLRDKSIAKNQNISRRSNGLHGHSKSIQQPRKMN